MCGLHIKTVHQSYRKYQKRQPTMAKLDKAT